MKKEHVLWVVLAAAVLCGPALVAGIVVGWVAHDAVGRLPAALFHKATYDDWIGKPAPQAAGRTLDGQEWSLQKERGKVVVLDFWATWCGPCRRSMPHMKRLHERYGARPDFALVGVSLDEHQAEVKNFVQAQALGWPQLFEEGRGWQNSVAQAYRIDAIPTVFVIGRDGAVAAVDPDEDALESRVKQLLGAS